MSDEIVPTGQASQVVEYLKAEFPEETPKVFNHVMRDGSSFLIGSRQGRRLLFVVREFLDDTPADEVVDKLRWMGVATTLKAIGKDVALVVGSNGLTHLPVKELGQ